MSKVPVWTIRPPAHVNDLLKKLKVWLERRERLNLRNDELKSAILFLEEYMEFLIGEKNGRRSQES